MNVLFPILYMISFAVILCGAFALMSQGFRAGSQQRRVGPSRHPEAPRPDEQVLYVDLNRERLEQLYQQAS